jgi:hypothetical protein
LHCTPPITPDVHRLAAAVVAGGGAQVNRAAGRLVAATANIQATPSVVRRRITTALERENRSEEKPNELFSALIFDVDVAMIAIFNVLSNDERFLGIVAITKRCDEAVFDIVDDLADLVMTDEEFVSARHNGAVARLNFRSIFSRAAQLGKRIPLSRIARSAPSTTMTTTMTRRTLARRCENAMPAAMKLDTSTKCWLSSRSWSKIPSISPKTKPCLHFRTWPASITNE